MEPSKFKIKSHIYRYYQEKHCSQPPTVLVGLFLRQILLVPHVISIIPFFLPKEIQVCVSLKFSHSVVSNSLQPHGLQHDSLPSPSSAPRACSKSCPLSQWCHPTFSSSVVPFSSCLQSFPASGPFPMSDFFTSGGQSIGNSALASVLPMNIQDWFPLGLIGLISLLSKWPSRIFFNITVQNHQFFGAQLFFCGAQFSWLSSIYVWIRQ